MILKDPVRLAELFNLLSITPYVVYQNTELNEAYNNAMILKDSAQAITSLCHYSLKDVLYGRYYWYTKFLYFYENIYGKDVGMEQAQYKIIETMDYYGIVDCAILESIEYELGYSE